MKAKIVLTALLLCAALAAWAQPPQLQTIKVNPNALQPITGAQQTGAQSPNLEVNTPEAQIQREMAELRRENAKLKAENAQLGQRIADFTALGGSEVHAYCSAETTSNNTAGASSDCGRYLCEPVTGQCRTQCTTSDQCGGAYRCDSDQRCKTVEEIQANNG